MEPLTPPAAHTGRAYQVQNSSSGQDSHPASKLPLQWALSDEEQQFCTDVLGGGLISSNDLEMICSLVGGGPWGTLSKDGFLVVMDAVQRRLRNAIKPDPSPSEPSQSPSNTLKTDAQTSSPGILKSEEANNHTFDTSTSPLIQGSTAQCSTGPDANQSLSSCHSGTGTSEAELSLIDDEIHALVYALSKEPSPSTLPSPPRPPSFVLPVPPPRRHQTFLSHLDANSMPPFSSRRPPSDPLSAEHLHVMLETELANLLARVEELSDNLARLPPSELSADQLQESREDSSMDNGSVDRARQAIKDELVGLVVDEIPKLKRQIKSQSQHQMDEEVLRLLTIPLPPLSSSAISTPSAVKSSRKRPPSAPAVAAGSTSRHSKLVVGSVVNTTVPIGEALKGNDSLLITAPAAACSAHLDTDSSQVVSAGSYSTQPSSAPSVFLEGSSTLRNSGQSFVLRAAALEDELRTDIFTSRRSALNLGRFFEDRIGSQDTRCTPAAADGSRDSEDGGRTPTQPRCSFLPSPPLQVAQGSRAATASSTTSSPPGSSRSQMLQEIHAGKALLPATVGQRSSNIPLGKVLQDDYGTQATQSPIECEPISGLELVLGPRISLAYPQPPARLLLNASSATKHTVEEVSITKENSEDGASQTLLDNQASAGSQDDTISHSSSSDDVLLPVGNGDEEDEYVMV